MVIACEGGHTEILLHLVKLSGAKDLEGPDGLNGLTLALGQLDSDLVNVLANPEVQPKAPEFLYDIINELDREISGEKSGFKRMKLESLQSVLLQNDIFKKFGLVEKQSRISTVTIDEM